MQEDIDLQELEKTASGDCYFAAWRLAHQLEFQVGQEQVRIVHGWVEGRGEILGIRFVHAWVELSGSVVFDRSNGHNIALPRELYYAVGGVAEEELKRYTMEEARRLSLDFNVYGPWVAGSTVKKSTIGRLSRKRTRSNGRDESRPANRSTGSASRRCRNKRRRDRIGRDADRTIFEANVVARWARIAVKRRRVK